VNALRASYDTVNNRVALVVFTNPEIECVTIHRHDPAGFIKVIPSLTYCPVSPSGSTTLYDWAAPVNTTVRYQAMFYSSRHEYVDSVEPVTAMVATIPDNKHWGAA
jgi:hypothetical protein